MSINTTKLFLVAGGAIFLIVGAGCNYSSYSSPNGTIPLSHPVVTSSTTPAATSSLAIIYTEQEKEVESNGRYWPTIKVLRKVGSSEPEVLAEVGKVGEYPNSFELSPDKKFLLINLESKLQIMDLKTKELKDLFIPKREVLSISYSPDRTQLFIWDQKYVPQDGDTSYFVHRFTIATGEDKILAQGKDQGPFFGETWRNDNKVILVEPHGEGSALYYFDLKNNRIIKTPGNYAFGTMSESGKLMAIAKNFISDVCDQLGGNSPDNLSIIDPVSGKVVGGVGKSHNRVTVMAFSPDDTEVLYKTEKPGEKIENCNKTTDKKYFKAQITTGKGMAVENPAEVFSDWSKEYADVTTVWNSEERTGTILVNGQSAITSDTTLSLVGYYHQK